MPDPSPLQNAPAVPLEALVTRTFPTWADSPLGGFLWKEQ